ncbi:MAG TPA: M15 family metallopeptidase [Denitromonas sp.]|nr:M15 family metallopeptidase [Denitromonas sp.]HQV13310.1 M15 family metallopeptidase [Denitromonas sp.]
MILVGLFLYFGVIFAAVVLLMFPEQRAVAASTCRNSAGALWQRFGRAFRLGASALGTTRDGMQKRTQSLSWWVVEHRAVLVAAAAMMVAPTLLAFWLRGPAVFDFSDGAYVPDRQIAALLQGEQLVPPPPLPPEVFTTREVEQIRPDVMDASRNWTQLDEDFTRRLLFVIQAMRNRYGYEIALLEGYRSPERQTQLAAMGTRVTQAGAYMSYHQYGLAADCAFVRDGKLIISESDPWAMRGYELYGELAESIGLTWGGRWRMRDFGHVELRRDGVLGDPVS